MRGEHVLLASSLGCEATGIDQAQAAVEQARAKADERGLSARFLIHDALDVEGLGEQFDTVLDSGLFTYSVMTTECATSRAFLPPCRLEAAITCCVTAINNLGTGVRGASVKMRSEPASRVRGISRP